MASHTTVDLLTESGLNILTENGSNFLIISRHLVVEVISGGGSWGQEPKWQPLDSHKVIRVTITFKDRTWVQEKEISSFGLKGIEMVKVTFNRLRNVVSEVKMWFRNKRP